MIRKPEAKAQAELIISALAGHGFTFKRGHALDLVAKLHGFRGWNEFQAAAKQSAQSETAENVAAQASAPMPAVEPEVSYSPIMAGYFQESAVLREGAVDVDDRYLVAYLPHPRWDSSTELLSTTIEGETYILRVCGQVRFNVRDHLTGATKEIRSSVGLNEGYVRALTAARDSGELAFLDHPFFEWINSAGDPVGGAFDSISANPHLEIANLRDMLNSD